MLKEFYELEIGEDVSDLKQTKDNRKKKEVHLNEDLKLMYSEK